MEARLFNRTTRSVALTQVGAELFASVAVVLERYSRPEVDFHHLAWMAGLPDLEGVGGDPHHAHHDTALNAAHARLTTVTN